jgi:hypothetical protein
VTAKSCVSPGIAAGTCFKRIAALATNAKCCFPNQFLIELPPYASEKAFSRESKTDPSRGIRNKVDRSNRHFQVFPRRLRRRRHSAPGRNPPLLGLRLTTGFSTFEPVITGKWLKLLKEIAPEVTRVLAVFDRGNRSYAEFDRAIEGLTPSLHLQYRAAPVANAADIEHAIVSFARDPGGGLIIFGGTVTSADREAIVRLADRYHLPAIYSFGFYTRTGGLMSYGVDGVDLWRRAATYVDRILRGAKPADLPVQTPTKFELLINLKTARALGLQVPPTLLALADEMIE